MDMTINNPCWKSIQAPWQQTEAEAPAMAKSA
jgi:nitrogenase molybdenum-iron protein alpha chain